VSYYGAEVAPNAGIMDTVGCPLQLHFGARDPYIPPDDLRIIAAAAADHDNVELHIEPDAGHAFHNPSAQGPGGAHSPAAAARAWGHTERFLARNLPVL
jgi:carboxymethylenebutenolidase